MLRESRCCRKGNEGKFPEYELKEREIGPLRRDFVAEGFRRGGAVLKEGVLTNRY